MYSEYQRYKLPRVSVIKYERTKMRTSVAIFLLLLTQTTLVKVQQNKMPEKAICVICAMRETEPEPEKVAGMSEYGGKVYYFCSDNCKKEFDADPTGYLPPVLPRPAPAFVAETFEGKDISLENYKGKVILLDFWATWCKPCEKSMPALQKLHDEFATNDFAVIGISIDEGKDGKTKVKKFIDKRKFSYPILLDSKAEAAWAAFKVKAIPAMFLIDREGNIVQQWRGEIESRQIKDEIAKLLTKE